LVIATTAHSAGRAQLYVVQRSEEKDGMETTTRKGRRGKNKPHKPETDEARELWNLEMHPASKAGLSLVEE